MKIIVGLGNPGSKYSQTRHNVGFMVVDAFAQKNNLKWEANKKLKAEIIKDGNTLLIKPQTFMNLSGEAVQAVLSYYKLLPKKLGLIQKKDSDLSDTLTVIHDDLDIEFGNYKTSINSRSAGHRGVQSIINHLKTKKFQRIRIGIRNESLKNIPPDKFVLQKFNNEEMKTIEPLIPEITNNL